MALSEEEKRDRQSEGGRKGGSKKHKNKGFGSDPEKAREAGKKGAKKLWKKEATSTE